MKKIVRNRNGGTFFCCFGLGREGILLKHTNIYIYDGGERVDDKLYRRNFYIVRTERGWRFAK